MAIKARNEECRIIAQHARPHNNGIVDNHGSRPGPQIPVGFVPGSGVPWGWIMGSKMDSAALILRLAPRLKPPARSPAVNCHRQFIFAFSLLFSPSLPSLPQSLPVSFSCVASVPRFVRGAFACFLPSFEALPIVTQAQLQWHTRLQRPTPSTRDRDFRIILPQESQLDD